MNKEIHVLQFRSPNRGEFGFKNCKDHILYFSLGKKRVPISYILGHNEYNKQLVPNTEINFPQQFKNDTIVQVGKYISDGSKAIDDFEFPMSDITFGYGATDTSNLNNIITNIKVNGDIKFMMFKDTLTKELLVKEISEACVCESFPAFQRAFEWLVKRRFETDNFLNRKNVATTISEESKVFRGEMQVEGFLMSHFQSKMQSSAQVGTIKSLLPLTDEELIEYWSFSQVTNKPVDGSNKSMLRLFDETSLKRSTLDHNVSIIDGSEIPIGILTKNTFTTLLLCSGVAGKNNPITTYMKLDFTSDMSTFKASCFSDMTQGSNKLSSASSIDLDASNLALTQYKVKNKIEAECDIPGKIIGLRIEDLDNFLNDVSANLNEKYRYQLACIELIPVKTTGTSFSDYGQNLSRKVPFVFNKMNVVSLIPGYTTPGYNIGTMTKAALDNWETFLATIVRHQDPQKAWSTDHKANGPSISEKKEIIAQKIDFLYQLLKKPIQTNVKLCLGFNKIDRSYIITNSNLMSIPEAPTATINCEHGNVGYAGFHVAALAHNKSAKTNNIASISPCYRSLQSIMMIAKHAGSWEKTHEILGKQVFTSTSMCSLESALYNAIAVANPKKESATTIKVVRMNSPEGPVDVNIEALCKMNDGFAILTQTIMNNAAINNMTENDTFINTAGTTEKLMSDFDCIFSTIRDNMISNENLMLSIYA